MINFRPNKKQYLALEYLMDDEVTEVLYGGAASGGKSYLGCAWLIISCLKYPDTRWLMGRSKLNTLKSTTLKTFNDILREWNIIDRFKINNQTNIIKCVNGSEIILKDLFSYPSDPDFDSLGSLEVTGAFIDEVNQISSKAFEIVKTRIRYKLSKFNIKGKCLMSCNPSKGWVYNEFYKPFLLDQLPVYRKFIPALATDNPNTEPSYIESLKRSSEFIKQRLLYGNWDYSDEYDSMFKYENLLKIKDNVNIESGVRYITADIARLGKDTTVIMVWDGLKVIDVIEMNGVTTDISASRIKDLCTRYRVSLSNVIIDADGIGGGVVDQLKGVKSFVNNSRAIEVRNRPNNYSNLKSQCYYLLAEYVELEKVKLGDIDNYIYENICQELQVIKQKDMDLDGKLSIIPKDIIKKIIGRSPDYADCMMMRMFFELKTNSDITRMRFY